jgi:hypothetical protein
MASGGGGAAAAAGALPNAEDSLKVSIPQEVQSLFKDLKTKRKYAWLLLRINQESFSLEVVKTGTPGPAALEQLLAALPLAAGAYFVYDLPVKNSYGGSGSSLRFYTWAPSAAPGKATVIYASQRKSLDSVFTGCIDNLATNKADIETALGSTKKGESDEWDPDA